MNNREELIEAIIRMLNTASIQTLRVVYFFSMKLLQH